MVDFENKLQTSFRCLSRMIPDIDKIHDQQVFHYVEFIIYTRIVAIRAEATFYLWKYINSHFIQSSI